MSIRVFNVYIIKRFQFITIWLLLIITYNLVLGIILKGDILKSDLGGI